MSYEWHDTRKCCHAKLYEKADPLKALGSVASFLRNRIFTLINDIRPSAFVMSLFYDWRRCLETSLRTFSTLKIEFT